MSTPEIDLDKIDRLASEAPEGPWEIVERGDIPLPVDCTFDIRAKRDLAGAFYYLPLRTRAYLAAVSPDVVRALIARLKRAELFLASANRNLPYVQGDDWPKSLHAEIKRFLEQSFTADGP